MERGVAQRQGAQVGVAGGESRHSDGVGLCRAARRGHRDCDEIAAHGQRTGVPRCGAGDGHAAVGGNLHRHRRCHVRPHWDNGDRRISVANEGGVSQGCADKGRLEHAWVDG